MSGSRVVVLAGGTGGAKLARGMLDVVGPTRLSVIANTGDDIEIYGANVSPDPDLISFWLADLIDDRGWGLRGDTFNVMGALRDLGVDVWFNLGDRDLAWCSERTRMQREGATPTAALGELCGRVGVTAEVLPMSDSPLRTRVNGTSLQEFLILAGGQGPVREVRFETDGEVGPTRAVKAALADAEAVVIGPSNPVISIWPILTALGEHLADVTAPVVCVSPVVGGAIVKGPTAAFLDAYGHPLSAAGVAAFYEWVAPGLLDGIVADEEVGGESPEDEEVGGDSPEDEDVDGDSPENEGMDGDSPSGRKLRTLRTSTLMGDAASRATVAAQTLAFAQSLDAGRRR